MSAHAVVDVLPERLRDARMGLGYTQVDLAKSCGMHGCDISQYENGRKQPTLHSLCRLAVALNVTTDWLLGLDS